MPRSDNGVERGGTPAAPSPAAQLRWAELMRRVFEVDVLECPRCNGRMRILASIHSTEAIRAILDCLGLPDAGPTDRSEPQSW